MPFKMTDADLPIAKFGQFQMDFHLRCLRKGAEAVKIGPTAFNVLEFLVKNRHHVVSKSELLKAVWGEERTKGVVEQAVSQLRRVLDDHGAEPQFIETIPGHGYRFVAQVLTPLPRICEPTRALRGPDPAAESAANGFAASPINARHAWAFSRPGRATAFWLATALLAGVVLGIFAAMLANRKSNADSLPVDVRFGETTLNAIDARGRELWTYDFGRRIAEPSGDTKDRNTYLEKFVRIEDLTGSGTRDILAIVGFRLSVNPGAYLEHMVILLSAKGEVRWSYTPKESFKFGDYVRGGASDPLAIWISETPRRTIWLAFTASEWGNCYVHEIDPRTGKVRLRFVNTGNIRGVRDVETPSGTYLLVAGFNNEYDGGSLAVMNVAQPFAASPQTPGTRHKCLSCPPGEPDYYFVFARSEINRIKHAYENPIGPLMLNGTQATLTKFENNFGSEEEVRYTLGVLPPFQPIYASFTSMYDLMHRDLEATQAISHSLSACPERTKPAPVRLWSKSAGWSNLEVQPHTFAQ